ncbi:hypothetical protein GGX14DRAFT_363277 [Mycena pura]|uniref:Uncharacterized protein n=1 Tax=Mycena pura TaxID=153505 RepID=A0AAD6YDH3_9AGAR|nr:hypothetical protein GGX14DRAFT_363277 [Mycena pura]
MPVISCPTGKGSPWQVGFIHNSYTYNGPLQKFTNLTESFFDISWYVSVASFATTGTDNVPGATRSGLFAGGIFNESLTAYLHNSETLEYTYLGMPSTSTQPPLKYHSYAETFRFESICNGRATYIDVITYSCIDNQVVAYNSWYTLHTTSFQAMAASLGATVMAGDCPRS